MTKQQTVIVLAMLSAYYGEGKADAAEMAAAWHVILKDYDFATAQIAVINFAKNDARDYAVFPSVGKIVEAIEAELGKRRGVFNAALDGTPYEYLPDHYQAIVQKDFYEGLVAAGEKALQENKAGILQGIMPEPIKELEDAYGRV